MGNLKENSIFELFCSKGFVNFRKKVLYYGKKKHPCDTCYFCSRYSPIVTDALHIL
ncbi:MAG: hypothetical protein LBT02_01015 [Rickettsiales bacterium]|nr:hypothetical protein [Rickettsiales bacterium]